MTQARPGTQETVWTTRKLLAWVTEAFAKRNLDSPKLSAEILLAHVLGVERLKLYLEPDREASRPELEALRGLVGRALKDEPVQYLTGTAWFFGLPFTVDHRVLVPRPCTELMVETVLQRARTATDVGGAAGRASGEGLRILDLCTGSGCIAIALAKNLRASVVDATDISAEALALAKLNADRHGVSVRFHQGDLFGALVNDDQAAFDFILSNPPYIPDAEWAEVPPNVRLHEPEIALRGGADGMATVTPLINQAARWLKPGGLMMIETAASTIREACGLVEATGLYSTVKVVKDHEGHERFVLAELH